MRVLVLGSSGVVGTALVTELRNKGHKVIEWDITLDKDHDLRVPHCLYFVLAEVDFVFFLAFDVGGSKYPTQSAEYISNNMRIIENTFSSLRDAGVPFVHTTSQMSNMDHVPYGPLKRIAEFYTEYIGGLSVKIWNVYGPEELGNKSHVLTDFIHQAKTNRVIQMLTTGEEKRQFLHTSDFARAMCHIMDNFDHVKKTYGPIVDVSNCEWVTIYEVAERVAQKFPGTKVIPGSVQSTFQTKYNEPCRDFLTTGWAPRISLEEGLEDLCNALDRHE